MARRKEWWLLLLVVPFLALLWPALYASRTPDLGGIPFFYWYQFLWVLLSAAMTGIVFAMVRD